MQTVPLGAELPDELPDESEHVPEIATRSGKNFECLVSNTAFNEYVALFFASDSVWPRVC